LFLRAIEHRVTGFANRTTRDMLMHLYTNYGRLTPADIQANDERLKARYDPNQPIESLFTQVEDAMEIADAANAPYSPEQIVNVAYNLVYSTGMFADACRDWRRRTAAEKNWANFKVDFTIAHSEYRDSQATANQAGYHSANAAITDNANALEQTADALANLATATASDRAAVANLTATNASLTSELALINATLQTALSQIAALQNNNGTGRNSNRGNGGRRNDRPPPEYPPNDNYCWTHGYKVSANHDSQRCSRPAVGHKRDATRTNPQGGSERGRE
jgi:hypothetical protein